MDDDYATYEYRQFLRTVGQWEAWGYPIYRTYPQLNTSLPASSQVTGARSARAPNAEIAEPESATAGVATMTIADREDDLDADPQWQQIVSRIQGALEDHIGTFPPPYDEKIRSRLRMPTVHVPGASIDDVRQSLRKSDAAHAARDEYSPLDYLAIVVDEEVAASVLAGREPSGPSRWICKGVNVGYSNDEDAGVVLKVVDRTYNAGDKGIVTASATRIRHHTDLVYYGWMKATPRSLYQLQMDMQLEGLKRVYKGPDFVYDG